MLRVDGPVDSLRTIRIPGGAVDALAPDLRGLPTSVVDNAVDKTLLIGDVLGHDDMADALAEFVALWEQRVGELAEHLGALATQADATASRYRETDETQVHTLSQLDSNS